MKISFIKIVRSLLIASIMVACLATIAPAEKSTYQRIEENYAPPDVILLNQDGAKVRFKNLVESGKPVIVDFIFGTCTTICPVLSAGFSNLQQKLGADARDVHLVSLSIDPENDTPRVMKEYLKCFRAKPGWDFLTGSRRDIDAVMRAFNAYVPNKMSHYPLTLIHTPRAGTWIRINGIMSTAEFLAEAQKAGVK